MPTASNITAPLLIIGPVRSGSTWLSEALLQHGQVQSVIENRLIEAMYHELFHSFWAPNLEMTVPEPERRQRAVAAVRAALCALFPSDAPFWAMKLLSRGRP